MDLIRLLKARIDVLISIAILGIVIMLILPISPSFLDVALALNITLSITIFITVIYIHKPLEISFFPGMLLIITLFRLSLNVSSTRLILGDADAGNIIHTFGDFVIKGNYIVGFMIFIILIVINFIVITKGATRISEVAARFTLDSIPGKQMAIDADLNNGLIDENEARERRKKISEESEFFGAMDGASKFIRGDAIAGIVITLINIVAGLAIGVFQKGFSFQEALQTYTTLTVGDGLVTQIPALVISTSAGLLVTKTPTEQNVASGIIEQLTRKPVVLFIVSGVAFFFGIIPGMPFIPFFLISITVGSIAYFRRKNLQQIDLAPAEGMDVVKTEKDKLVGTYIQVDPISIDLGSNLLNFVSDENPNSIKDRIPIIRKQLAMDLGIILPKVRIRDSIKLNPNDYTISIRGNEVTRFSLKENYFLAIPPVGDENELREEDNVLDEIHFEANENTFFPNALWINDEVKKEAQEKGYKIIPSSEILILHFMEIIKQYAFKFITRDLVNDLVENLRTDNPKLIEDTIPEPVSFSLLQKIIKYLISEDIPINDLGLIIENAAELLRITQDAELITEEIRSELKETIVQRFMNENNEIITFILDSKLEKKIGASLQEAAIKNAHPSLHPNIANEFLVEIEKVVLQSQQKNIKPILMVAPNIRRFVSKLISSLYDGVIVLSYGELPPTTDIKSIGMISIPSLHPEGNSDIKDTETNKNGEEIDAS
ncbi:MAG: flagellar biosynthesis protein FlhA [Candidatus Cloacimonadota bacterium]|nr:flagellar biosynthesis protein FlhA [Candidatus Cloacimonadota bacterium]